MLSSGSGTPMVPHWAKSLLGGSHHAAPDAGTSLGLRAPQHVLRTVETPLTASTTHSPPEVFPVEMDDENDVDYNDNGEADEESDEDGMDISYETLRNMRTNQEPGPSSLGPTMQKGANIPASSHNAAPSTRTKTGTRPIPRAASISSSSGGSDIPDVLPSYRRATSGSSQATAEISASLKRGLAAGGPVLKRPRISNIADGVITSRYNDKHSSAALQSRRRSDAARSKDAHGNPEPHITKIESDVVNPGDAGASTFNPGAQVSDGDPDSSSHNGGDPYALPEHLTLVQDGRRYTSMPGIDPSFKTKGALFPTGYQVRPDLEAPFICAVRDCQTLLPTLKGLGSHFISKHSLSLFNDNLDGTMSFVRHYTVPSFVKGPPLIISRKPPGPDELPPVPANVPNVARRRMYARGPIDAANLMHHQASTEEYSVSKANTTYTPVSEGLQMAEYTPMSESTPLPEMIRAPRNKVLSVMPEMESWEVAPGHIRDGGQKGGPDENVAFSNAYITSNAAISVSADIGFNVATIKPGGSYKLAANTRVLRVCSVASGKLRVKLDEKEFQIGCNGVIKVRAGSTMTVENRLYVDSVLHILTINEY